MQQGESSEAGLRRSQRPKRRRDFEDELGEDDGDYYGDDYEGQEGEEEFDDEDDSEYDEDDEDSDQEGRRTSARQRGQEPQQQAQRSTTTALTDARLVVDYGALTREYEQRGGAATPFPDYADTILKLTHKANQKLRKSRKKAVAEDDDDMGKKKKKRKGLGEQQLAVFGEAQALYMRGELSAALASVNHLLQLKYYSHEVAALRSRIAEEMGHAEAAAEWCLVASRFGKTDRSLWKKAGQLYLELGPPGYFKAQYCFARAFKLDGDDYEALAERAQVYSLDNKVERAVALYEQVLRLKKPVPTPEVFLIRMAEDCFREKKLWPKGSSSVYQVLCRVLGSAFMLKHAHKAFPSIKPTAAHNNHKPSKEMGYAFDACSVYCRHLMSPHLRKYEQAAAVIEVCEDFITRLRNQEARFQPAEGESVSLPLDLAVQYGICQLHLDKLEPALRCFKPLQDRDPNDPAVVSLLEAVAGAYVAKNMHFRAIGLLRRVHRYSRVHSLHTSLRLQLKVAHSYMAAKKYQQAEELALKVIATCQDPEQPLDDPKLAALREATVVWSQCARALSRPLDVLQTVLDAVTFHVQQLVFRLPPPAAQDPDPPSDPPRPLIEAELGGHPVEVIQLPQQPEAPPPIPPPEASAPLQQPMQGQGQSHDPSSTDDLISTTTTTHNPTNPEPINTAPTITTITTIPEPTMPLIVLAPSPPPPPPPTEASPPPQPPLSQDEELLRAARERVGVTRSLDTPSAPLDPSSSASRPAKKKRWQTLSLGVADDPTTVPPEHLEFQLLLEFGLLSRCLTVLEDFFTACLALVELAVFQSKNRYRESSKTRMLRLEEQGSAASLAPPTVAHQDSIHPILTRSWERTHMQNDVEAFVRDRAFSHNVKEVLGEGRVFEAVRAIIDTCMDARMVREASMVLKQVMKRKKLLSDEHIRELSQRGLASGIALTDGHPIHVNVSADTSSAAARRRAISGADIYVSIRNALQNAQTEPHSVELLNSLCRKLHQVRLEGSTRLYIRRLSQNNPTSAPLGLMAGHNFASSRNFKRALSSYLDALRVEPQDPLLSLCVAVLLLRALCHKKMQDRHGCILKGMAFLEQYAAFRINDEPLSPEEKKTLNPDVCEHMRLAVRQEVMYNQGRAFHQAGLTHMAIHYYMDALALFDAHRDAFEVLGAKAHVTREAAHNLAMVYAESGNRPRAAAIVTKYLSID